MSYKQIVSDADLAIFMDQIKEDSTTEILPTGSEWEIFRYRREEWDNGKPTGCYAYGTVYRNKKGRLTFTGEAELDFPRREA